MQTRTLSFLGFLVLGLVVSSAQGGGVTIVTHGQDFGDEPNLPVWVAAMVAGVGDEYVGGSYTKYRVTITSPDLLHIQAQVTSYSGANPSASGSGEILIELDWSAIADAITMEASTADIATLMRTCLESASFFPDFPRPMIELPIHLIGHSRGGALQCQLADLLGKRGAWVNHLSTLDPHPADNGIDTLLFPMNLHENVVFADNYRQTIDWPDGKTLAGSYSRPAWTSESTELVGGYSGAFAEHSDVHLWYYGSIKLATPADNGAGGVITATMRSDLGWWQTAEESGSKTGHYFSRLRGGSYDGGITRPLGSSGGLLSQGAHREPWDLDVSGAAVWDNIEIVDFEGNRVVQQGSTFPFHAFFLDHGGARDATITVGLDSDRNPYNGTSGSALYTQLTSGIAGNEVSVNLSTSGRATDDYYVYAKISNGTHIRYYYAQGTLSVVPVSPRLDSPAVNPPGGVKSDNYTYTVHFYDETGAAPQSKRLYIDGSGSYNVMTLQSGSAANGVYTYTKNGFDATGTHTYYFYFVTGNGTVVRLPAVNTFSGPVVSSDPDPNGRIKIEVKWGSDTSPAENGEGGFVDPNISDQESFSEGEQHWFTAYPAFGWRLDEWKIRYIWSLSPGAAYYYAPDATSGNSAMMITRDYERDANNWAWNVIFCKFRRIHEDQRILTVTKQGPGTVDPAPGQYEYPMNDSVNMTATPSGTGRFVKWMLDGMEVSTSPTYSLSMAAQDHTIQAVFQYNQTAIYTNELPCIADASIRMEDFGDDQDHYGYGSESRVGFKVATPRNYTWDTALKFDLSSIPADATIQQIYLRMYCVRVPNRNGIGYEVQKNTSAWDEDTILQTQPTCLNPFVYNGDGLFNGGVNAFHEMHVNGRIPAALNWINEWRVNNYGIRVRPSQYHVEDNYSYEGYYDFSTRHVGDSNRWPVLRVVYEGRRLVPEISVEPGQIEAEVVKGEAATNIVLRIWNSGEGTLNYVAAGSTNWVGVTAGGTGSSTGDVKECTVQFDPADTSLGLHTATLFVGDGNAGNSPVAVPVTLRVRGPAISASPAAFEASALMGQMPDPLSHSFNIWNSGYGTLDYTLVGSAGWMTADTSAGSLPVGEIDRITASYADGAAALPVGTYTNWLRITNSAGYAPPFDVLVVLSVYGTKAATPYFVPNAGPIFTSAVPVSLYTATDGATIRYTVDGTSPDLGSPVYTNSPVIITNNAILRAIAWKEGMFHSDESIASFEFFDSNGNGIADRWEIAFFGGITNVNHLTDFDGDKLPDYYEYLADLDPTNSLSCIRFQSAGVEPPGCGFAFRWYSGSGMVYRVARSTNLVVGFGVLDSNLVATPPMNVYTDKTSIGGGPYFYRLELDE